MLREDIPEALFSSIKEDDPDRASKLLQIERWCYANWDLHTKTDTKGHNFLAQVLSDKECWKEVGGLHGVKLDRQVVGKKLIVSDSDNPFGSFSNRYRIACRCCLEEDIRALFEERKGELSAQDDSSLLEYEHLVKCLKGDPLKVFWSHFVSGYISKLDLKGLHPYEYGLDCAIDWKQAEAVECFWNKIKPLPEDELSVQKKDEIFMKNTVYTAGSNFRICPDIFEFCLSQISPDKYPELLKRDLERNTEYASLYRMIEVFNFDQFQKLFDFLKPCNVPEDDYYLWLKLMVKECPEHYLGAGVEVFMHMWKKEGFDNHRIWTLNKEMTNDSVFQGRFLAPLIEKGFMGPVWAMLNGANSRQIKEFMSSEKANYIRSILEQGDNESLNKFLAYCKSADEELDQKNIPGPSGDLAEVELSKVHGQSYVGLGDH